MSLLECGKDTCEARPGGHQQKFENGLLQSLYCFPIGKVQRYIWEAHISTENKTDVWQGTLVLMVLKTLETMGPLHGYGIARRIEQTSGNLLLLNYGTLYPALLKLEQEGSIASEWGLSENNRKAKFYRLTRAGRRQLQREERDWAQATAILGRFLSAEEDPA
jgi:transcriptional regulator